MPDIAGQRGALIVEERTSAGASAGVATEPRERRFRDALAGVGGGLLADAIRRDGAGAASRVLARAAWVPDLAAGLAIQAALPPGWIAVPRDGGAVVSELAVALGAGESVLERRAEATRLGTEAERLGAELVTLRTVASDADADAARARVTLEAARGEEARGAGARREAEEEERVAARDLEGLVREAAWASAQADRLRQEHERSVAALAVLEEAAAGSDGRPTTSVDGTDDTGAVEAWEGRATELRARRDRLAEDAAARDAGRREAEGRRARAEAAVGIGEERMARADRDLAAHDERARALAASRGRW